jgi:hypothetical protein
MATKVYLSGLNVIVEQSGTTTLTILQERAKYTVLQPTLSLDGISAPVAEYVQVIDIFTTDTRTELIAAVTDSSGATFADLKALQKYLVFIPRADTTYVTKQAATAENQTTIISQNAEIVTNTESIKKDVQVLENIKEDTEKNNKILAKIYNHE